MAFPELRIIADFQAGCPTGALVFWPRITRMNEDQKNYSSSRFSVFKFYPRSSA
jgi:hypothetical protein